MTCAGMLVPAAILGTSVAFAGPLDDDLIPSSAQWVVHLDMESVADSTIGKILQTGIALEDEFKEMRELGIDPLEDLYSVTGYGWGQIEEHNMVLVIHAAESVQRVLDSKAREAGIEAHVEGDWTFYEAPEHGQDHAVGVHQGDDDIRIFIAADRIDVETASRGRDGDDRAPVLGKGPRRGAMVFAAARDLDEVVPDWGEMIHSQLVNSAEGLLLEVGEHDGMMRGRIHAACDSTETSEDIVEILRGSLAVVRVVARDNEDMRPLLALADGVRIDSSASVVEIDIEMSTESVMMLMEMTGECEDEGY